MAVVPLNETPIPGLAAAYLQHLQYDSVAIDLDDREYSRLGPRLVELSSREPGTDKAGIGAEAIRDLLARPGSGTAATCRAILTNAQYHELIEYLSMDEYYYQSFGDPEKVEAVLAFSFGEMPDVNVAIAERIMAHFWSTPESRFRVPVYAQWEITDALWARLKPGADQLALHDTTERDVALEQRSLDLHRIGGDLVPKNGYIRTEEVVAKCQADLSAKEIALACQACTPRDAMLSAIT